MRKLFVCGDGKRFANWEDALEHCSKVFRRSGIIISVERR